MLSAQRVTPCYFPPLKIDISCLNILESCKSYISIKVQDTLKKEMPIMEEVSLPFPHMLVSKDKHPNILVTCLN